MASRETKTWHRFSPLHHQFRATMSPACVFYIRINTYSSTLSYTNANTLSLTLASTHTYKHKQMHTHTHSLSHLHTLSHTCKHAHIQTQANANTHSLSLTQISRLWCNHLLYAIYHSFRSACTIQLCFALCKKTF